MELRVVRGAPEDEELAALCAVLSARAAAPAPTPPRRRVWDDPGRRLGALRDWRSSALPR